MLVIARDYAQSNLTGDVMLGHIPVPAGAISTENWRTDADSTMWFRCFEGHRREVGPVVVSIDGVQHPDGTVERTVSVYNTSDDRGHLVFSYIFGSSDWFNPSNAHKR